MKKLIKYPSTNQFRQMVSDVNRHATFVGLDENGDAIYDGTKKKPIINMVGTVKLHGSSLSVCYNEISGMWVQSRTNIITSKSDNAGSAFFCENNEESLMIIFNEIKDKYNIDTTTHSITICSEWAGGNIQKNVGISNIEKSMFIFGIKISPIDNPDEAAYWVDSVGFRNTDNKIYNINDFPIYEILIDFNRPELSQNKIIELTIDVENECPVAKSFGFPNTIGEGIVFGYIDDVGGRHIFKSKGELHAKGSKVKVLKQVDDEKINKCIEIAEKITPVWRLQQGIDETFDTINGGLLDIKKMGLFIKWVISDVIKEESDILFENGIEPKDIGKYISQISKDFLLRKLNEEVGLN